jgi:hypothetical protein
MGGAASVVTKDEIKDLPQFTILGGEKRFDELAAGIFPFLSINLI